MPFIKFHVRGTERRVVPTAVYFLPQPGEERVLVGEAARAGPQSHPVPKKTPIYSNLKILFKSDLIRKRTDLGHSYFYEKVLHIGESTPRETTREFLSVLWKNLDGAEGFDRSDTRPYIGKPAYGEEEERRFSKNIREIFRELGFSKAPVLVYEPYALFYYCRFGLAKPFVREDGKGSNILVVDQGGGTVNTCIVQTTRTGNLKKSRPKSPQASQHGGSLLDQYLLIRAIKQHRLPLEDLLQIFTDRSELKIVDKEQLLLQVEELKIRLFEQDGSSGEVVEGLLAEHNLPGVPRPWRVSFSKKDVRDGFLQVWSGCHSTIATTLRTSGVEKVDFVILAGGTCRLGFHKELLKRDFGDFFAADTQFIDISSHEKPVAYGLAIQALLDSEIPDGEAESDKEVESPGSADDENLAEYVARDLKVAIGTDAEEEQPLYNLAEEVVIAAGAPKTELWEKGVEKSIPLQRKPKRQLRYAFFSERPARPEEQDRLCRTGLIGH
ncbi:MAG: hypothetical protein HY237_10310 [Acidobacteria bacterium]|nr:hypothetical protein [Acidobacteriota bacterium]